ncbi:MAG: YodC family protein [Pseudorhodoplanes sp.]|uniref:YodC family protein n=1 Tax=Pseudorhodoplanes sp. TaxID=1934341 RepID=UPI003D109099
MSDSDFKPGDAVSLKSGGPRMTIAMVDGKSAFCEWFTDDQQLQSRSFALTSLMLNEER